MTFDHLNILHTIRSVGPGSFGLGATALNLAREQNSLEADAHIWSLDNDADRRWASESSGFSADNIRLFPSVGPRIAGYSRAMEREASLAAARISVVHQHALWTGLSRVTTLLRERHGVATVITPHGSLEKWAIKKSWWKKRIALALYEKNNLYGTSCLHAVGQNEISGFRNFGLRNPIAVIPNGISSEWLQSQGDAGSFRSLFSIPPDNRILLFLSRITPKKGLPMFLETLKEQRKISADWTFVVAGSDEFDHLEEVRRVVTKNGMASFVKLVGPLYGQIKRDAFAAAELFVLPSYSEGAPIVILEALGAGVPVLATKASPWQELEQYGCGWWVDISGKAIAEALDSAVSYPSETLRDMGKRGKDLVHDKYSWTKSAQMTIELYEWLLGRRGRPSFVVLD